MLKLPKVKSVGARLISQRLVAKNTIELTFNLTTKFSFLPGQYLSLFLDKTLFHDFSIASSPNLLPKLKIAFRHSQSEFKTKILLLPQSRKLRISGPKGSFVLPEDGQKGVILIAGGIGVTPFMSMISYASEANLERATTLLCFNHDPANTPYHDEIKDISQKQPQIQAEFFFQRISQKLLKSVISKNKTADWYIAGLPGFVQETHGLLEKLGILDEHILTEEFSGYE